MTDTEKKILEKLPQERKGEKFNIKVNRKEAEYLLDNNDISTIFSKEGDWIGLKKEDFSNPNYTKFEHFEIDLNSYTHSGLKSIYNSLNYLQEVEAVEKDLFNNTDKQPKELRELLEKWTKDTIYEELGYLKLQLMLNECEKIGYTFEYELDAIPFGLRPIDQPLPVELLYNIYTEPGEDKIIDTPINNTEVLLHNKNKEDKKENEHNTETSLETVGKITFFESNGEIAEIMEYSSIDEYLSALNKELDSNPNGFKHETILRNPELLKKVDDIIYGDHGAENPNSIDFYIEKVQKEISISDNVIEKKLKENTEPIIENLIKNWNINHSKGSEVMTFALEIFDNPNKVAATLNYLNLDMPIYPDVRDYIKNNGEIDSLNFEKSRKVFDTNYEEYQNKSTEAFKELKRLKIDDAQIDSMDLISAEEIKSFGKLLNELKEKLLNKISNGVEFLKEKFEAIDDKYLRFAFSDNESKELLNEYLETAKQLFSELNPAGQADYFKHVYNTNHHFQELSEMSDERYLEWIENVKRDFGYINPPLIIDSTIIQENYDVENPLDKKTTIVSDTEESKQESHVFFENGRTAIFSDEDDFFKGKISAVNDSIITIKNSKGVEREFEATKVLQLEEGQKYGKSEIQRFLEKSKSDLTVNTIKEEDLQQLMKGLLTKNMYEGTNAQGETKHFKMKVEFHSEKKYLFVKNFYKNQEKIDWKNVKPYGQSLTQNEIDLLLNGNQILLDRKSNSGGVDFQVNIHYDKDLNAIVHDGFVNKKNSSGLKKQDEQATKNSFQYDKWLLGVELLDGADNINKHQLNKVFLLLDKNKLDDFLSHFSIQDKIIDKILKVDDLLKSDSEINKYKYEVLHTINSSTENQELFKEYFQNLSNSKVTKNTLNI